MSAFNKTWIFSTGFEKSLYIKIRPLDWVAPCGQMDGQTGMTKLIVAFPNFANAPKYDCVVWDLRKANKFTQNVYRKYVGEDNKSLVSNMWSCYWIKKIQNKLHWQAVVIMVMNSRVVSGSFLIAERLWTIKKLLHGGVSYMSIPYLIARSYVTLCYITQRDLS